MRNTVIALAVSAFVAPGAAWAQGADHAGHHSPDAKPAATDGALADGEVRKVDKDAKKLTIRHGPLPALDMPMPMTMVYQVRDAALLDRVQAGDKIRFLAEKIGGQFTVTQIETVK